MQHAHSSDGGRQGLRPGCMGRCLCSANCQSGSNTLAFRESRPLPTTQIRQKMDCHTIPRFQQPKIIFYQKIVSIDCTVGSTFNPVKSDAEAPLSTTRLSSAMLTMRRQRLYKDLIKIGYLSLTCPMLWQCRWPHIVHDNAHRLEPSVSNYICP